MFGPWLGLLNFFGHEIGSTVGKAVVRDVKQVDHAIDALWSQKDKIAELASDKGLSPSYLKDLIEHAHGKEQFAAISNYLADEARVMNLTPRMLNTLRRTITGKLEELADRDALKEMLRLFKEQGTSMLDSISNHFDHFL